MAKKKASKKGKSTFMAPLRPSDALAAIVGYSPLPRTKAVSKLWAYIKRKKLQDKKNKRQINPDAALAKVFGTSRGVNMFAMMKHLKKHLKTA
jgi:chromatin remodeling complex protein RSC6